MQLETNGAPGKRPFLSFEVERLLGTNIENPVSRLRNILNELRAFQPDNAPLTQVLGFALLRDRDATPGQAYAALAQLMDLFDDAKSLAQSLDLDEQLYLTTLKEFEQPFTLTLNLTGAWSGFRQQLPDGRFYERLDYCVDVVQRSLSPGYSAEIPAETIAGFQKRIVDLLAHLTEKSVQFDPKLHEFLLDHLQEINAALSAYRLSGTRGLRRALDRFIGDFHRRGDSLRSTKDDPIWKSVIEVVGGLDNALSVAERIGPALPWILETLQRLPPVT